MKVIVRIFVLGGRTLQVERFDDLRPSFGLLISFGSASCHRYAIFESRTI